MCDFDDFDLDDMDGPDDDFQEDLFEEEFDPELDELEMEAEDPATQDPEEVDSSIDLEDAFLIGGMIAGIAYEEGLDEKTNKKKEITWSSQSRPKG